MAKYQCSICGYTHEGSIPPKKCPVCFASVSEFSEIQEEEIVEDVKEEAIDESVNSENNINPQMDDIVNKEVDKTCENDYLNKEEKKVIEVIDTNNAEVLVKDNQLAPDEEEIISRYNSTHNNIEVIKWYKETYKVGLKEAKERVDEVLIKHNLWNGSRTGGGCVVTILVAITSTLSLFWLL